MTRGLLAALALVALALPAAARAAWTRPFQMAPPGTLDVAAPAVAIAGDGDAAAAFGLQDVDVPGSAQGWLALRAANGALSPAQALPGTSQVLSLTYDGRSLELLTGTAPAGQTCCSSAQAMAIVGGRPRAPRTLVGGLTGATDGQLLTIGQTRMLAAVATERGVWVAQSSGGDRFGSQHRLTGTDEMPQALAAVALGGGDSLVAWSQATGPAGAADPRTIAGAAGSRRRAPHRTRTLVTVRSGHRIDEIGLAPRAGKATLAWVESWFDAHGAYHSVVREMDIVPHATARTLSPAGRLASGLSVAGDAAGDQAVTWASCTSAGACSADVAVRRAKRQFGSERALGAIDSDQSPALAVSGRGRALVGWVRGGDPVAAVQARAGGGWDRSRVLSRSGYAYDLAVAAGPRRGGLVAWTQGTLHPSVVAAADSAL